MFSRRRFKNCFLRLHAPCLRPAAPRVLVHFSLLSDQISGATLSRPKTTRKPLCFQLFVQRVRNSLSKWDFKLSRFHADPHSFPVSRAFSILSQMGTGVYVPPSFYRRLASTTCRTKSPAIIELARGSHAFWPTSRSHKPADGSPVLQAISWAIFRVE